MLEFDFRNGPLRRKFDGLKYALRLVEDIIFESSLIDKSGNESPTKRLKMTVDQLVPLAELDSIRLRLEQFDIHREDVIKKSRDIQKLSKHAIFCIHRNNIEEATSKLDIAKAQADSIYCGTILTVSEKDST